jgi:hypothetical protein
MLDRGAGFTAPDLVMRGPTAHANGLVASRVEASESDQVEAAWVGVADSVRVVVIPKPKGAQNE